MKATKTEIEVFIHMKKESWQKDYETSVFKSDMSEYGYALITRQTLTFLAPEQEKLVALHVAALEKRKTRERADFSMAQDNLDNEIQALKSITLKSEII